ncbi:peptidoglycan/xylan/chitin deacetylase (PgdA/CDA1 family) [Evansella vedderi]|uniref:Peptidoglycan/xylan/chitin deacetylase (PgdA/CDA1 family) n=1 Tax=Evansella vedderi TaxID=38282 RepID=A0ABT9ZQN8_9BACI|nr:polysaccharide deacetylase family protein [Evansella vedderi]MDQ0253046.1 peptidoglycan/xylan/chitin deacetylase (PgdA/CDA1 family) [Evansella vedderi]
MSNRNVILIVFTVFFVITFGACENQERTADGEEMVQEVKVDLNKVEKEDYILEIIGESQKLSDQYMASILDWRVEALSFAKEYEHIYLNGRDEKMVALTFDDGPDNNVTPAVIEILEDYGVKGAFFFVGDNVETYASVVGDAYEKGHIIASHSYHHVQLPQLSESEVAGQVRMAEEAIERVIGKKPALFRNPYGDINEEVAAILDRNGYSVILWSIDSLDYGPEMEGDDIVDVVLDNVRNGDIILMHSDSSNSATVDALPTIIIGLQEKGFEIVDLETILNINAYK